MSITSGWLAYGPKSDIQSLVTLFFMLSTLPSSFLTRKTLNSRLYLGLPGIGNGLARDIVGMEDAIVPFLVGITDEQIAPKAERDHPTTVVIRQLYFFDTQLLRRGEFNPSQIVR